MMDNSVWLTKSFEKDAMNAPLCRGRVERPPNWLIPDGRKYRESAFLHGFLIPGCMFFAIQASQEATNARHISQIACALPT